MQLAYGGVEFVPHPGYPEPNYFSGTNSRAFYRAYITGAHNHIAKMEILLNDSLTHTLNTPFQPGGTSEEGGTLGGVIPVQEIAVMFDSFYFSNGTSSIQVKCRVLAETQPGGAQQWFEHSYTVEAKNKNAIFSLQELEDGTFPGGQAGAATEIRMNQISHPYSFTWQNGWNAVTFADKLLGVNAVSVSAHANSVFFEDGVRPHNCPNGHIYALAADGSPSVQFMRNSAINYPWPPFNLPSNPSFNIVAHFSCDTTQGPIGGYSMYLYPYWNGYGEFLENQAFMGFNRVILVIHLLNLSSVFWGSLNNGKDIENARIDMMSGSAGSTYPITSSEILGDQYARFRRVYNPGNSTLLWWRAIPLP